MIHEHLGTGATNAKTSKQLAIELNVSIRSVMEQIERERRQGFPICASKEPPHYGYYLAKNVDELSNYCNKLAMREREINITRWALAAAAVRCSK